jgi:hypothetical protein
MEGFRTSGLAYSNVPDALLHPTIFSPHHPCRTPIYPHHPITHLSFSSITSRAECTATQIDAM